MSGIVSKVFGTVAKGYQGIVASRLGAMGLKYDDLMIEGGDLEKALGRTAPDVTHDRELRIKRAFDLSSKRKALPADQAPSAMDHYIHDAMELAKLEREERAVLNKY